MNPTPEYKETEHKERLRAGLVVTIAVVFNAVMLWPETQAVHRLSDQPAHVAWVRWAADRILDGHSPLDGWLPQLALGAPHFHQYEVLPHIVGGFFATVFDPATVVNWSTYLLVASWPVAVYAGARLLDRDRRVAVIAAVLAPLLASTTGFGFEWSSYTFTGFGLWAQVFGMWLLPLTMGFTWRAIDRGRGFAIAAVLLAATLCSHFVWGYVGFIWLGIVVVAGSRAFGRRLWRGALVAGGALLASAWLLVPLAVDASWIGEFQHRNRTEFDSYGARTVLEWLVTGKLLDFGRPYAPVITVVAFVGVGVCVARFRRDVPARLILLFTAVGLVLYFGRPTLGPVVDWIPGLHEIPLHRFVAVVQMGALLLAGIGGSWLIGVTIRVLQRVEPNRRAALTLAASVVGILVLVPAVTERGRFAQHDDFAINAQRVSERYEGAAFADLVAFATRRGGGRISAGNVTGAGVNFRVGQVPSYAEILNDDGLGIGFAGRVASLSVDTELGFNVTDADQFPIYAVHYIILPSVGTPIVPATLLRTRGPYSLFEVGPPGYLRVADILGPPIVANRATLGAGTTAYLGSNLARFGATRPIAFDGAAAMHPTARELEPTTAGAVQREVDQPDDGEYRGTVHMQRRGAVVLAASYHPRWTVTVDGKPQQPEMVAPSFVAVVVPPGVHHVVFSYRPYPGTSYALLFMVGIAAIGALLVIDRRQVDRRAPRNLPRIVTRATAPDAAP